MQRSFYAMGSLAFAIWTISLLSGFLGAGTITKPHTFTAGTTISPSQVNANFDAIISEFNGNISSVNLLNSGIATEDIAASSITSALVLDRTLVEADILAGTLTGGTSGNLAAATVTGHNLGTASVTETHVGSEAINSAAIRNFSIVGGNGGDLASGTITGGNIATSNVTEDHLAVDSVRTAAIQSQSVASDEILNFSIVGGNGGDIASGTITGGNLATDNVTQDHIAAGSIRYSEVNVLVDTLPYAYANLKVNGYTSASNFSITADWVTLQNPDDATWIVVKSVSITSSLSSGSAALNGQATAFAAGSGTQYFVWIGAKSDGTAARLFTSTNSAIATVQNEVVAIDATYTYVGLYSTFLNQAAGSYDIRNFMQVGAKQSMLEGEVIVTRTTTGASLTQSLAADMPTAISTMADISGEVDSGTSSGSTVLLVQGEAAGGSTLMRTAPGNDGTAAQTEAFMFADYPTPAGNLFYDLNVGGGSGGVTFRLNGFHIDHLRR